MPEARLVPTPAELLDAPGRAMGLSATEAVAVLAQVGALEAVLRARIAAPDPGVGPRGPVAASEDGLLTVDEACGRLGLTREQFYRRARRWPWVVKLGRRTMRVKVAGLTRYLAGKKA